MVVFLFSFSFLFSLLVEALACSHAPVDSKRYSRSVSGVIEREMAKRYLPG